MPPFGPGEADRIAARGAADRQAPLETPPMPKHDAEGRILKALQEIPQKQGWRLNVSSTDGRALRLLTEAIDAKNVVEIGTSNDERTDIYGG